MDRQAEFLKQQEERLSKLEKKISDRKEANQDNGLLSNFLSEFNALKTCIESKLNQLEMLESDKDKKSCLNDAVCKATDIQVLLNDSLSFLPVYDLRKSQDSVTTLHELIAKKQKDCMPKKRFAFGKKKNIQLKTPQSAIENIPTQKSMILDNSDDIICRDKSNEVIHIVQNKLYKKDVLLKNLKNCTVELHSVMGTLHCTDCTDCIFSLGPISGSLFLEDCSNSVFHTTCQQARIHKTYNATFYIHVTSKAIIEDCKGLQFGKRTLFYKGYEDDRSDAGLMDTNNWNAIDDFNWLSKDPSPNWSTINTEI